MNKRFTTILKIGVTLVGLTLVLSRFDLKQLGESLATANIYWLSVGFSLVIFSLIVRSYRWHLLLKGLNVKIRFWKLVELYFVGNFFNSFLPSGFGGDVVRVMEVAKDIPPGIAAGTVLIDRLTGLLTLFGMALLVLPFRPAGFPDAVLWPLVIVSVLGLVAGIILLEGSLLRRFGGWLPGALATTGDGFIAKVLEAVEACGWRAIGGATAVSLFFNLLQALWWLTTGYALGLTLPYTYYLLVIPIFSLSLLLPSIGGLGVRESIATLLFTPDVVAGETAVVLVFLITLLERSSGLLGGLVYLKRTLFPIKKHTLK